MFTEKILEFDTFPITVSSEDSGSIARILDDVVAAGFKTKSELSSWIEIDLKEERYVRSVAMHGANKSGLKSVLILVTNKRGQGKQRFHIQCLTKT